MFYLKALIPIELLDWVLVVVSEHGTTTPLFEALGPFLLPAFNSSLMQLHGNYCTFGILCHFKALADLLSVVSRGGVRLLSFTRAFFNLMTGLRNWSHGWGTGHFAISCFQILLYTFVCIQFKSGQVVRILFFLSSWSCRMIECSFHLMRERVLCFVLFYFYPLSGSPMRR